MRDHGLHHLTPLFSKDLLAQHCPKMYSLKAYRGLCFTLKSKWYITHKHNLSGAWSSFGWLLLRFGYKMTTGDFQVLWAVKVEYHSMYANIRFSHFTADNPLPFWIVMSCQYWSAASNRYFPTSMKNGARPCNHGSAASLRHNVSGRAILPGVEVLISSVVMRGNIPGTWRGTAICKDYIFFLVCITSGKHVFKIQVISMYIFCVYDPIDMK